MAPLVEMVICFQCFTYLPCPFVVISMLHPRCLASVFPSAEKFHGYRISWTLTPFLKPGGPCLLTVCLTSRKMEKFEVRNRGSSLLLLSSLLWLSLKCGGQCQTLMEDLSSLLVMLRKGDHEKWRRAGGSFHASPGNTLNKQMMYWVSVNQTWALFFFGERVITFLSGSS